MFKKWGPGAAFLAGRRRPELPLKTIDGHNIIAMPDVGLTTASDPLPSDAKVVIKYSVEVDGLPVYQESYDAAKLEKEIRADREQARDLWFRRISCVIDCRHRPEFSASLTRCLDGGSKGPS